MYKTRDHPGQDPFKFAKPASAERKACDFLATSFKAAAVVFLVASISFVLYSSFNGTNRPVYLPYPARYIARLNSDLFPTNISHIAFGIGGSARTWMDRRHYSDLWYEPNTTRGFVFLDQRNTLPSNIPSRVSSDWTRFKRTVGSESAVRIARAVVDLFRAGLPEVRWFVMGDDDTVFFPDNLVSVLGKYDHRRMVYVGGNSESVEQNVMHAYDMAFGGGGFAISYPLAAEVARLMDGCLDRYHYFYGSDQRVWACVGELGVPLTIEPGFHQIDIRGDPFGLLAAHPLTPLVSLHHLDHVKPLFPNQTRLDSLKTLMNAYKVDPSRTLQQCICYLHKYKWSVSISWGYTIQIYPMFLTVKDLERPLLTFQTWRSSSNGPFTFNTRAVSSDPCEQPVIFYLNSVTEDANDKTITAYKKFVVRTLKKCSWQYDRAVAIESIIVSASKMDAEDWKKRPRRQCCEIKESSIHQTMRIEVRKCKHSETISI
ncbi:uncharacterized protein [Primulina huaijiensis]|uniref:uncharacterized protein n=1 Tax=Primulina huaijiensis TaxID=1492673 RepID=UPI003CC72316